MGHRDFDAALAEAKKEQPTFTLAGQHFTCRATLPWKALEHLIEGDGLSVQVHQFFANVLVKSDRQRFADLVEQEDPEDDEAVSVEQITDVMNWLTEHYTGKAEQQSPSSTDGPEKTGRSSRVVNLGARTG
jgi:hypothetical protein